MVPMPMSLTGIVGAEHQEALIMDHGSDAAVGRVAQTSLADGFHATVSHAQQLCAQGRVISPQI